MSDYPKYKNGPVVYVDVYKCGVLSMTVPFYYLNEQDHILAVLGRITYVAKGMEWESHKINHICNEESECRKGFNPNQTIYHGQDTETTNPFESVGAKERTTNQ